MTIRNLESYTKNLWDWGILNGCFGNTRIAPSDLDGEVERNGHLLVLEAKSPGVSLPEGQRIKFDRRSMRGDTIFLFWGKPSIPEQIRIWRPYVGAKMPIIPCSTESLRTFVSNWYEWANKNGS